MRKFLLHLLVLLFIGGLVGCQKEVDGTLSPGNTTTPSSNSYLPLSANTYWSYKDSATGTVVSNVVTNKTKTINNIPFNIVLSTSGTRTDSGYYAVDGPDYYVLANNVSPSGFPVNLLFHFLNDTASVGYSWEFNAGHGNGFTAFVETTIMEKGITHTVSGKTYPDVIHTKLVLSYDVMGSVVPMGTYDYFIAKGVGVIRVRTLIDAYGMYMRANTDLIEYRIP